MRKRRVRNRQGTAAQWTSINPILLTGEIGIETDTKKIKAGDGSTAWTSLGYIIPPTLSTLYVENDVNDVAGSSATINASTGRFRVSMGTTSFTLTNDKISSGDTVLAMPCENDVTGRVISVIPGNGGATIKLVAPMASMYVMFLVVKA